MFLTVFLSHILGTHVGHIMGKFRGHAPRSSCASEYNLHRYLLDRWEQQDIQRECLHGPMIFVSRSEVHYIFKLLIFTQPVRHVYGRTVIDFAFLNMCCLLFTTVHVKILISQKLQFNFLNVRCLKQICIVLNFCQSEV